jgi:phosphoglucomutase
MAYVGDKKGPKMSDILERLGREYFGLSKDAFRKEVYLCEKDEREGVVDPVLLGSDGRYYIIFNDIKGNTKKFYLEEMGYIYTSSPENVVHEKESNNSVIYGMAKKGISHYLRTALNEGKIDEQIYNDATRETFTYLDVWLNDKYIDKISPNLKLGLHKSIKEEKWEDLVNAFWKKMDFGTGGIRGLMANDKKSIEFLDEEGIDAPILKGPNTLNNVVLLLTSAGVAKFGLKKEFKKIVIGYDSRIRGKDFATAIAELFLAYGYKVYLFDEPCPYPEVTFAIPSKDIKADMGILISASHNDFRYNGYKLSCGNGSQFDPDERTELYQDFIAEATTEDIKQIRLKDAPHEKLVFLGGSEKISEDDFDYYGFPLIDIHKQHQEHIKTFLLFSNKIKRESQLRIGFCAFHGAGIKAVPKLLKEIGFDSEKSIRTVKKNGLDELDGLFPSFCNDPGKEQQPDPGDLRAAKVAVKAFQEDDDFSGEWENLDILIGTDPDADRCGVVVKVPEKQQFLYENDDYMLMPADDMWALILWFRLKFDKRIQKDNTFIVLSHTTSDLITKIALKHNLGVVKSWVGFAALSAGVRDTWENTLEASVSGLVEGRIGDSNICHTFIYDTLNMFESNRSYNLAAMEQSNGFSILGSPPPDAFSLGENGHVRDKDGTFAAVLIAEIAAWAKKNETNIFELVDKNLYLDPDIGLFVNKYEPDPMDGEYPGIEGNRLKKSILRRSLGLYQFALAGGLTIGSVPVVDAAIYRTGKYDHIYTKTHDFEFPDEGIRFYFNFGHEKMSYLTICPSGTSNALRFHVQLHSEVDESNLIQKKAELHEIADRIMNDIREKVGAPRLV